MKTISKLETIRETIAAKNEIAAWLPKERKIYETVPEFVENEVYNFDAEKFDSDNDYFSAMQQRMKDFNMRSEIFNTVLESVMQFLLK